MKDQTIEPSLSGAGLYTKKPVTIEAIQWTGGNLKEVIAFTGMHPRFYEWFSCWDEYVEHVGISGGIFKIFTLEGTMEATPGDWIIRGIQGEHYPCKPDIFAATYEPESDRQRMGEPVARTDEQIVQQTEELARLLMLEFYSREAPESALFRNADDPRGKHVWGVACLAQEILTATDPENSVAELDDAPQPAEPIPSNSTELGETAEPVKVPSDAIDIGEVRRYLDSWGCLEHPGVRALLARYGQPAQPTPEPPSSD